VNVSFQLDRWLIVPCSGAASFLRRETDAVSVIRTMRLLARCAREMRRGSGGGPSGAATPSLGSSGQSIRLSATRSGLSVIDPALVLSSVVRAFANARVVLAHGWSVWLSVPVQTSLSVFDPLSSTVPAMARTSTLRKRPATKRTVVGRVDWKRAVRMPSDRFESSQSPDAMGALVWSKSAVEEPEMVRANCWGLTPEGSDPGR
jgi:hypothetical protein